MIGTKLYKRKSQTRFFLGMYALLALLGAGLAALSISAGQSVSASAGFMIVFGLGMAALTKHKSDKPQVSVYPDFIEVSQSGLPQTVRYRNITAVSRPDKQRLVVSLREDGGTKNVVVWLRQLEPADIDKLQGFLVKSKGKRG